MGERCYADIMDLIKLSNEYSLKRIISMIGAMDGLNCWYQNEQSHILTIRLNQVYRQTIGVSRRRAAGMCFFESEASFEEVMCLTHGGQSVLGTTMRESLAQVI